jgi:hypothetical protein
VNPSTGVAAWQVYCHKNNTPRVFTRREIADRLLEISEQIKNKRMA